MTDYLIEVHQRPSCGKLPLIHEARLGGGLYRTLEVMQRYFWKTIKADGNDGCSDADRGIAHHIAMFPWSRAHMPWQNRIKSDRIDQGRQI
jgi:hypothetical protein